MLERARSPAAGEMDLVASHAAQLALPRLLVVDDDDLHRLIICRVATKAGYAPVEAGSFEDAALLARETAFDCITLDLSLGEHDGAELLRHLRTLGCTAPIVIISGCDSAVCRETLRVGKSLNLNIAETVHKPVDLVTLRDLLESLKGQRSGAAKGLPLEHQA